MGIRVFYGITRKVVPAFVILSAVGWVIFVAGFALQNKRLHDIDSSYKPDQKQLYPYWAGCVIGPVVFLLAIAHALLWGFPSAIVGSLTAFLSMMYISAVSAVLYKTGLVIDNKGDYPIDIEYLKIVTINLQFAGGFITVFFWSLVLALWPWYKIDPEGQFTGC